MLDFYNTYKEKILQFIISVSKTNWYKSLFKSTNKYLNIYLLKRI